MRISLEEERKAILERMDTSRRTYRQMFGHEREPEHEHPSEPGTFPRSHTFKFITHHPYVTSLAALALIAALPRGALKKAAKGGAAVTAGVLRKSVKASVINHVLPSVFHLIRSRRS
jgi:hypothetical protein